MVEPTTHEEGAEHVTTARLVPAATLIALDHAPAGPTVVVVVVVVVEAARGVVVVVAALDFPGA